MPPDIQTNRPLLYFGGCVTERINQSYIDTHMIYPLCGLVKVKSTLRVVKG